MLWSWQHWLQQHQLSSALLQERLDLDLIQATFSAQDWEYLVSLQTCLSSLDEQSQIPSMQKAIAILRDRDSTVSAQKVEHFALDYTVTEISGQVCCL